MQTSSERPSGKKKNIPLTISLLVAIIAILIGIMPIVIQLTRLGESQLPIKPVTTIQQYSDAPVVTVRQYSDAPATIVYTSSKQNGDTDDITWSADGKRIATVLDGTIYISDALTGLNSITLSSFLTDTQVTPVWSSSGELLAVPNDNMVAIVDGETGGISATYKSILTPITSTKAIDTSPLTYVSPSETPVENTLTVKTPTTREHELANHTTLGRGPHVNSAVAWSPDGTLVLSTFFYGTTVGTVQAWDPTTGDVAYTLTATTPGDNITYGSWSSDGKYIATYESSSTATMGTSYLDIWDAQTHQMILQKTISSQTQVSNIQWQPGTDNLTYDLQDLSDNSVLFAFWNVQTNQITKTISQIKGAIWSPDGKKLAYSTDSYTVTNNENIVILDVNSGQAVSIKVPVQGQSAQFMQPIWSPDSKYIVTAQNLLEGGVTTDTSIIQVLVA